MENKESAQPDKYQVDKYKELYEHAKFVYKEELSRFTRIDEKAARYLIIWGILYGVLLLIYQKTAEIFVPIGTTINYIGLLTGLS